MLDRQFIRRTLRPRTSSPPAARVRAQPRGRSATAPSFAPAILCAACRHPVTSARERIAAGGSPEHRFFNPYGVLFHIGCFRTAAGCFTVGEASLEFTWFPHYAWRIGLCRGCRRHLGWRFEHPAGDSFFGLVLNRLVIVEGSSGAEE